jgi:hypothetical protein
MIVPVNQVEFLRAAMYTIFTGASAGTQFPICARDELCKRPGVASTNFIAFPWPTGLTGKRTPEKIARITAFLDTHESWHMLLLGGLVNHSRRTDYPSIRRVRYRSLTHAYVIHRRLAEDIVRRPWQMVSYDSFLKQLKDPETYALYPSIAFQSDSRSDNERYLPLDRFRRWCGGLKKIQQRNELYHSHRWLIISTHVVAILLLLWGLGAFR